MTMGEAVKALVLAAGKGTRLQTAGVTLPKVMRQAAGRPLLAYVLDALVFLPQKDIILVVGYRREDVLAEFGGYPHCVQEEQLGTGHAVQCAAAELAGFDGHVLICCGDMPLMKKSTYESLVRTHLTEGNACTILSGVSEEALPYGRIVRDGAGRFSAIVEDKDCTPEQKTIRELNAGVYLFHYPALERALAKLRCENAQKEYYLTDCPALIAAAGGRVGVCDTCTPREMLGVNTPDQLREVEETINAEK